MGRGENVFRVDEDTAAVELLDLAVLDEDPGNPTPVETLDQTNPSLNVFFKWSIPGLLFYIFVFSIHS